jgi:5-carboxymethyl-2-hydroxymuconate isomerase
MIKIYGLRERLDPVKAGLSDVINDCMVQALQFPADKRAHRFFPMDRADYYYPAGRSDAYTVIEIAMMSGRSDNARKALIHGLFEQIEARVGISKVDVEIMIFESPPCNFGFRGQTGDEAKLNYRIDV